MILSDFLLSGLRWNQAQSIKMRGTVELFAPGSSYIKDSMLHMGPERELVLVLIISYKYLAVTRLFYNILSVSYQDPVTVRL